MDDNGIPETQGEWADDALYHTELLNNALRELERLGATVRVIDRNPRKGMTMDRVKLTITFGAQR